MDVRFLNTFIEVANTKHFGRAAENLYLTQSAVSARIKLLEEYFNAPLFIRERHSIRLTSVGEKLLPYAESMVSTLQEARKALEEVDVQHLSLAGTLNAWQIVFSDLMKATNKHLPDLSLRSEVLSAEQLTRQLLERTVDVAFSLETLKSDDIHTVPLGEVRLRAYRTINTPEDTPFEHYIHIGWSNKFNSEFLTVNPRCRQALFKTSSLSLALELLDLNDAACLVLPESLGNTLVANKKLVALQSCDVPTTLTLYVSCLKSTQQTSLEEYFRFYADPVHFENTLGK
ncbi:LysR family transcriptional regulator [Alteromonas sp. KUL49]|uniref:LysR family transcriptional regulator n=1 Tax=Alteromonas sp. KUL49 TaxID=2480798 RepID=UPI0010FFADE4|nr:LysR family transcriptional regulator [Alteromonas sp. KUL49]GEA12062.1 LysR family transcriptional regulator [Alteromonas sp. KUL49]